MEKFLNMHNIETKFMPFETIDKKEKKLNEEKILKQLHLIRSIHKSLNDESLTSFSLEDKNGKLIENYKVKTKRLKEDVDILKNSKSKNAIDELIIHTAPRAISRAEYCIGNAVSSDYVELINRAVLKKEICIGNVWFDNLSYGNGSLRIKNFNHLCYDMIENDAVYFLSKLKRKGYSMDWISIVSDYCNLEDLDDRSLQYILSVISFPYEYIKCWYRYKKREKNPNIYKYEKKFYEAMVKDGKSII